MTAHFKALDDATLHADLQRLAGASATNGVPTIQLERVAQPIGERYRPQAPPSVELRPRRFTGGIPTHWRISSFSGLVATSADELPDHDSESRQATPAPAPVEASGIFAFPRGKRAGTCLHQVFEELDFAQADDLELRRLVESKLRLHGIPGDEFAPAVCETVRRALATPLDATRQDFTLSRVTRSERLNELEFFLPVRELTPALLRHGLAAAGEEMVARLGSLGFKPAGGFLKGFIDLVFRFEGRFYIVDWKSNWLGHRVEDYGPAAMRAEMARKFYALQAHLYVVALHEYLRLRLPGYRYDEHFGGVRYVFLRGLDPSRPELGVHRDRPEAGTIEALAESLRNGKRAADAAHARERAK
jgi:exodeoxyribonuclease V beta subunit